MDLAYFSCRSGGCKKFFGTFFSFFSQNFDALYRPVARKPCVVEDLCLHMGTSVACAVTAEAIFEIVKCISDVDMPARERMGSNSEIFRFFNSGYAQGVARIDKPETPTIEIFRFLDVGHRE